MPRALFKKPKTRPPGLARSQPRTEASIWRGSTRDIADATYRVLSRRPSAPLPTT